MRISTMDRVISRENIKHFQDRLGVEIDPDMRSRLHKLLAPKDLQVIGFYVTLPRHTRTRKGLVTLEWHCMHAGYEELPPITDGGNCTGIATAVVDAVS